MTIARQILFAACFLAFAFPAAAQQGPGGPPAPGEDRPMERVERLKKIRLIELLEMGEEQSVRFFARMSEHERARRDLVTARSEVLDRLDRLVRNKAEGKEYEKVFAEVRTANQEILDQDRKFFDGLGDILSVEQRAKLLLFERRFEKELREAMRDAQRRRRGMGEQQQ